MEICEQEGFFHQDYDRLRATISENELRTFSQLKTDRQRVRFVEKVITERCDDLWKTARRSESGKNLSIALEQKNLGNQEFQYEKWSNALRCYNRAILRIPSNNVMEKSIILANRSAALFHLNKFEEALQDINLSIDNDYPKAMRYKLMERKARCYFALKDLPSSLECYREMLDALKYSSLDPDKQENMIKDTYKKATELEVHIATIKKYLEPVKHSLGKRKFLFHLDKAVYFDCTEKEGRFACTKSDLRPNQLVLKELPHASVVNRECNLTHCDNCCSRVDVLFCCPNCVDVAYCSPDCQKKACSSYHRYECGFLQFLWKSGANVVCMLALRIITQKSVEYFYELEEELEQLTSEKTDGLPYDDYRKVFKFVTHSEQRGAEDYLKWTLMATLLNTVLKLSVFYKTNTLDTYIGALVLHNMQIVTYNSHEISELQRRKPRDSGFSACIGAGLYPTLVLFNHSCDPGITRYFVGNAVYVRTVKNIPAGSVLAENYGQLFVRSNRHERRNSLKSTYKFICGCQACEENWPMLDEMSVNLVRFRCTGSEQCDNVLIYTEHSPQDALKCEKCGMFTSINECFESLKQIDVYKRYNEATDLYQEGEFDRALSKYAAIMSSLDQVLVRPYREYHICQQGIRRCSLELGNKYTEQS
ncbi:SET and MYND domain-containing protein 4-like [Wyeomyia smithii]|uniref:SET and MYND domain-containing protein 4-like n=1 Tax=Wyeomyia smithii TaxID=174621 RepID=UPI0024682244|nr:SET and MYND domain-containing protein 4-like [Wyeomyia smithii]